VIVANWVHRPQRKSWRDTVSSDWDGIARAGYIIAPPARIRLNYPMNEIPSVLRNAIVYDLETFPSCFTFHMEWLESDAQATWEISEYKDEREGLLMWLRHFAATRTAMIGFNNINFDYPIIHYLMTYPFCTVGDIYVKSQAIITGARSFDHIIWESDRFAPQVDLFKINHFDNRAKTTSLKALQVNMRSPTVVDSPLAFGTHLTREQIDRDLIPYNRHDVKETKRFAFHCMPAIAFRSGLVDQFGLDVLNYNDSKIGSKILEKRLNPDTLYYHDSYGKRHLRQSPRQRIALGEIIFPNVRFSNPEFQRILEYMRAQVLVPEDLDDSEAPVQTKGVFSKLSAQVGGVDFHFGTGGVHASVVSQCFVADDNWLIRDIDVTGLYPNIAVVNQLAPEHLGYAFVQEYARLLTERKLYPKGTVQNASYKLAANGTYGNSNNKFSVFYDPKFTMTITINGQLMLCMLAEMLAVIPTLQIIQTNTDGISYRIHRTHEPAAAAACRIWEYETRLTLESVDYARMWIADVNTYLAETTDGKLKQKGRLWHPDPDNYAQSISEAAPPAWHKDLGNVASIRAAVQAMVNDVDPETWLHMHRDPFDFMCRVRCDRSSKLMLGTREMSKTVRYYVALRGAPLTKISPPAGVEGAFKRGIGVSEVEYNRVMAETGGAWDERVCTKNKSRYVTRTTAIEQGYPVAECNDAAQFDWENVNYDWYLAEARKLIIA